MDEVIATPRIALLAGATGLIGRALLPLLLASKQYRSVHVLLRRAAPDIDIAAVPVEQSQFYAHDRGASLEQIRGLLQEYAAIVVYWWRGWI